MDIYNTYTFKELLLLFLESLIVVPISQSSAIQRAGRAGRMRSGKTYRLYTEDTFGRLEKNTPPEMQRVGLSSAVLQLKALGIDNIVRFDFISVSKFTNSFSTNCTL